LAQDRIDSLLRKVPVSRRKAVKVLLIGSFVVPVVASFPMDGRFAISSAMAQQAGAS
jgi:hypothetical protein